MMQNNLFGQPPNVQNNNIFAPQQNMYNPNQNNFENLTRSRNQSELIDNFSRINSLISDNSVLTHHVKFISVYGNQCKAQFEQLNKILTKDDLKKIDRDKLSRIRETALDAKKNNDKIIQWILKVQDIITRIAINDGRVESNPEKQSELYKRIHQTKRALAEIEKKFYEIKVNEKPAISQTPTTISYSLKELENGLEILNSQVSATHEELKILQKYISK